MPVELKEIEKDEEGNTWEIEVTGDAPKKFKINECWKKETLEFLASKIHPDVIEQLVAFTPHVLYDHINRNTSMYQDLLKLQGFKTHLTLPKRAELESVIVRPPPQTPQISVREIWGGGLDPLQGLLLRFP